MALFTSLPPCSLAVCCQPSCSQPCSAGPGWAGCPGSAGTGRAIGHRRVTEVSPGCRGNACQGIDKQQICVTADAFLMACPEVQTLGLYPPASQPSAQQSLLRKQSEGCHRPCFPALLMHLPLTDADKERQIWSPAYTVGLWGAWGAVQCKIKVQILLCPWVQEPNTTVQPSPGTHHTPWLRLLCPANLLRG